MRLVLVPLLVTAVLGCGAPALAEPLRLAQSREEPDLPSPAQPSPAEDDSPIIPPDEIPTLANPEPAASRNGAAPRQASERPEILRDAKALPEPARRMRDLILKAARSGDIERLRPLIGIGDRQTRLAFEEMDSDPIAFLKSASGDEEGHEILGIIVELLEAGFVKVEEPEGPLYVWPYFFAYPIAELTPPQKVELFRILTGGDWQDMQDFGAYIFYRLAITPEGEWKFFLTGDA